jgi:nucleotide-binding universal stress UspA family protein
MQLRTILHPTDFSDRSDYAFRLACSLAADHGASVVVLHVAAPPSHPFAPPAAHGDLPDRERADGFYDEVAGLLRRLRAPGPGVPVRHRLEEGDPVDEIVRASRELGCDLIVMGTHGRAGLGRFLLGSVAEEVVRRAPCPVLTVKVPPSDEEPPCGAAVRETQAAAG